MASPLDRFGAPSPSTDIALGWLNQLTSGDGNALVQALNLFSIGLAGLASMALGYWTLASAVRAANEGQMLSKALSVYGPVRAAMGLALLAPVFAGLGGGQWITAQGLAAPGSGLASRIWYGFVQSIAEDGRTVPVPRTMTGSTVALWAYQSEVCRAVVEVGTVPGNPGYRPSTDPTPELPPIGGVEGGGAVKWDYGAACGAMALPVPTDADGKTFARAQAAAVGAIVAEVRASGTPAAMAQAAIMAAGQGGGSWPSGVAPWLDQLASRYDNQIMTAASTFVAARDRETRSKLVEAAKAKGWVEAGQYWRGLAQLSAAVVREAERLPDRRATAFDALDSKVHESMVSASTRAAYQAALGQLDAERRAAMAPTLTASDLTAAGDADSFLMRLLNPLWLPVIQGWLQPDATGKTPQSDPIADLVSLGHATLGGAQAALIGGATLGVAACNIAGTAAGLCGAYEFAKPTALAIIYAAMAAGAVLAYVLPLLPWIWIMFAAAAWLVALVEAMIATPILALLFVRLDGEEFVDTAQRAGVALLFALMLNPIIVILSLCGAYYVLPWVVGTMRAGFAVAYLGQQGGHFVGPFGILIGYILLAALTVKLALTVLAMIAKAPDRISRIFGAPGGVDGAGDGNNIIGVAYNAGKGARPTPRVPGRPGGDGDGGESGGAERGGPGPRLGIRRGGGE